MEPNDLSMRSVPKYVDIFDEIGAIRGFMAGQQQRKAREGVIDENLKRVYHETVEEGIPDRFKDLLEQLKRQDADKEKESGE